MKRKLAILALTAAACMSSLAEAGTSIQNQPGPAQGGIGGPGSAAPGGGVEPPRYFQLPPEPEARADDLRLNGRCNEAIPIYGALADLGRGYELAEFNLGQCLIEVSKNAQDAQQAANLKREAARHILKAANTGLPNAQLALVTVYLDGVGIGSDPVEAGKWSLIYHSNGTRMALGLPDVPSEVQARLDAALTDKTWSDAQSRAAAWTPPTLNVNTDN
jgi:TPR repeat protein